MNDLKRDEYLWLLHTDGRPPSYLLSHSPRSPAIRKSADPATNPTTTVEGDLDPADDDWDESNRKRTPQRSTGHQDSSSQTLSKGDCPNEEDLLQAIIDGSTEPQTRAASFLDLHQCDKLAKPLIGRVEATMRQRH